MGQVSEVNLQVGVWSLYLTNGGLLSHLGMMYPIDVSTVALLSDVRPVPDDSRPALARHQEGRFGNSV